MIKQLFKDKNFISGLLLFLLILIGSLVNTEFFMQGLDDIPEEEYFSTTASPPSLQHPFGTERGGVDLLDKTLSNTVPTIKMALYITIGRMIIALVLGLIYGILYRRLKWLDIIIEGFNFVPATLFAFIILNGLNFMDFEFLRNNPDFMWFFIAFTLMAVGIPPLTQLIGKETRHALQNEYIESSLVLGGSRLHILIRHIIPAVRGKFLLFFNVQLIAVLTLMMHISILEFFIPGWTEYIGSNYFELMMAPWIVFFPVLMFTLLIVSITLMTSGIKTILDGEYLKRRSTFLSTPSYDLGKKGISM